MSKYDDLRNTIAANPELSTLLEETVTAVREYVKAAQPIWKAEEERAVSEAKAAGKRAFGVPFHPEQLVVDGPNSSDTLPAFLITGLELSGVGTAHEELATAIRNVRNEYLAQSKGLIPAP
jgi:hypothetical protein